MKDILLFSWDKNLDYGQKLLADLPEDRVVFQPAENMNHPAWVFSHLNAYHPVITAMIRGEVFDDPKEHPFGMKSKPVTDASVYPTKSKLVEAFVRGHHDVTEALRAADEAIIHQAVPLERWVKYIPNIGAALGYLMILHESTHLGQISAWRRVQGMAMV